METIFCVFRVTTPFTKAGICLLTLSVPGHLGQSQSCGAWDSGSKDKRLFKFRWKVCYKSKKITTLKCSSFCHGISD